MANVFLAIPQYKRIPAAEVERIRGELCMDGWKPAFEGFHPMFDQSVQNLFNAGRHRVRYCTIKGDGNLPRARSHHLGIWRQEYDVPDLRCSYFMIVDDDISFPPEAIDILIADDKPIVGGIYTFKTTDPNYVGKPCTRFFPNQVLHEEGPVEVQWLNGGFIMVKADTLLTMIDKYPELIIDMPLEGKTEAKVTWALWCPRVYDRIFLGEDWAFCQRAREIGFPIYADLRVKLVHWNEETGFAIGL